MTRAKDVKGVHTYDCNSTNSPLALLVQHKKSEGLSLGYMHLYRISPTSPLLPLLYISVLYDHSMPKEKKGIEHFLYRFPEQSTTLMFLQATYRMYIMQVYRFLPHRQPISTHEEGLLLHCHCYFHKPGPSSQNQNKTAVMLTAVIIAGE